MNYAECFTYAIVGSIDPSVSFVFPFTIFQKMSVGDAMHQNLEVGCPADITEAELTCI